jgi:hypothetical protein
MADISNIDWSPSPYDGLTIPDEKKGVLMALAESRIGRENSTLSDDAGGRHGCDVPFEACLGIRYLIGAEDSQTSRGSVLWYCGVAKEVPALSIREMRRG